MANATVIGNWFREHPLAWGLLLVMIIIRLLGHTRCSSKWTVISRYCGFSSSVSRRLGFKVVEHMKWLMAREETKR